MSRPADAIPHIRMGRRISIPTAKLFDQLGLPLDNITRWPRRRVVYWSGDARLAKAPGPRCDIALVESPR